MSSIIREHGNMLDVTINGKMQTVPKCTCGKCIVRKLKDKFLTPFPYNPNMNTTYGADYDWKTRGEDPNLQYNRAKHNSFEGAVKRQLPTQLMTTHKMSYRPFKVHEEDKKKPYKEPYKVPFIGKSTYTNHYPSWGDAIPTPDEIPPPEQIDVPLRGVPNYVESYPRHDQKYYKNPEPVNFNHPTLRFAGDLDPRTTYGEAFKPTDLSNKHYFPDDQLINGAKGESTALDNGDNAPGIYGTTYRHDYIPYEDDMCRLRKWLNARNMRYLVI